MKNGIVTLLILAGTGHRGHCSLGPAGEETR